MDYIELTVTCPPDYKEIFIAELSELGFESFVEQETGVQAYIPMAQFEADGLKELTHQYESVDPCHFEMNIIQHQNWNETWEKTYEPIAVEQRVRVRATFHEADPAYEHEIVIDPKMSFGTGHHATTYLMLKRMLQVRFVGKRVYDVGTGTGILAIMAAKLGAVHVEANDVEDWTVEACRENCERNGCGFVQVSYGALSQLSPEGDYDIMLANINRNILLQELPLYAQMLRPKGMLFLSGFYEADVPMLTEAALEAGLTAQGHEVKDDWCCLKLEKLG